MTTKICDICNKHSDNLNRLADDYKSSEVVEVCDECMNDINNVMQTITKAIVIVKKNLVRRFINALSNKFKNPGK